ncbi:MAG: alanine:cation symporter family protein [Pseudomonadota bacterium]
MASSLGSSLKGLARICAICLIAAFAFGFNALQGNTVAGAMQQLFGVERLYTGLGLAAVTALTVFSSSFIATSLLRVAVIGLVFLGASAEGATSVFFSDPMMGIVALVNLMAILMLFPVGLRLVGDYTTQLGGGVADPVLDPAAYADLDIDPKSWPAEVPADASAAAKG